MPPAPGLAPTWVRLIPNLLTLLRILVALAFPFLPALGHWRLAAVVAAGATDGLDGFIARRFHATSVVGGLLDGIADKLFVVVVLLTLAGRGEIGWWQLAPVLARDLVVGAIAAYAAATRRWEAFHAMPARLPGKITTLLVFVWFCVLLIPGAGNIAAALFTMTAVASAVSALDYLGLFIKGLREH